VINSLFDLEKYFLNLLFKNVSFNIPTISQMPYFKNKEGYNLYYEDINGEIKDKTQCTVILLHGFASSASFFKHQIALLKEDYRIIAFDALGHGRSEHPKELNLAQNLRHEIIRDLEDLLTLLDVNEKYGIIGHSLVGGMIGQLFCMSHPKNVKFLILLNSGYIMIDNVIRNSFYNLLPYFIRMNFLEVASKSIEDILDKIIPYILISLSETINGMKLDKDELYMLIEEQIFSMIDEMNNYDPSAIKCPTLIIGGRLDNFAPEQMSEELHKKIPHSILKIIDMAGHFAPAQRSDIINDLISEFIKKYK
jgi:pimeloyl-ACP methyl ester carboxylesterase